MTGPAEALSPDTDAIKKDTLEWTPYRNGYLVRYKDGRGYVRRIHTNSWDEANTTFEKFLEEMRQAIKK